MDFALAMHVQLWKNTEDIFPTEAICLRVYFHVFTEKCMKLVVFQVSVCVQSDLTYGRIFLRWLKEV